MNYFDRYLAARGRVAIERDQAELISLTCVMLAAKFVDRQSPVRMPPSELTSPAQQAARLMPQPGACKPPEQVPP